MGARAAILVLALALVAVWAACAGQAEEAESVDTGQPLPVQWVDDWEEAKSMASEENKPIMVNFYTDICPTCDRLDRDTFANEDVRAYLNDNFINVKSHTTRSGVHEQFGIRGVPTTVFATPGGEEMGRIFGYYPPEAFLGGCQAAQEHWNKDFNNQGS
jgi:thioredoxin-related protein